MKRPMVRMWNCAIMITFALATVFMTPYPVHAAGTVLVDPSTIQTGSIDSSFTVDVKVANIDPFNGWDIQIVTDPLVINATGLSTTGNTIEANYSATPLQLANCINGAGQGCVQSSDGPGVVHSAVVFLGGQLPPQGPTDGLLFTITYTVVGSRNFSPIEFQKADITNGGKGTVIVSLQDGVYGVAPLQDFAITPPTDTLRVTQGTNSNLTLRVSSIGGFSNTVTLTNTSSLQGLSIFLNTTSIALTSGEQVDVMLKVAASNSASATQYTITVRGTSGFLSHRSEIAVIVSPKSDFILVATPSLLRIHATDEGSSTITLLTQSGFSGTIQLAMAVPPIPGLIALLGERTLTIAPDSPATTIFVIKTPDSALPFQYLINITATSQSLSHSITIVVRSPSADFWFIIAGTGHTVQAGQSKSFTLNFTSVDYFKGQIFLLATSLSGAKEAFSRPRVALEYGNSTSSAITISTDTSSVPGKHIITLTALGTTFLGVTVNHSINMTVTITAPAFQATILGLQPITYFGLIGVLWVALIGVAIREIKKPKPRRFLT